jgi:hypothetical protein
VDDIQDIFTSIDGAVPARPFARFTGGVEPHRATSAAAAGILEEPDGRHYVAYLEKGGEGASAEAFRPSYVSYVSEDLRLHQSQQPPSTERYAVRYLEAFDDAFKAGEIYNFFWSAMHPTPEPDDTDEQMQRDRRRGMKQIEDFIRNRAARARYDELLRAEEELAKSTTTAQQIFWQQARETASSELLAIVTDPDQRERDLAFHRYRRAAYRAIEEEGS